jgi:peptidoglycan/LPS O-acetylase OafA/YrhL
VVHYYSAFGAPQYVLDLAGHHAVTFFFVLSGFILCYVYPELAGWKARGRFLLARLARVYPTHLASLALLVVLLPEVGPAILARPSVLVANLCLVQSWVPRESYYYSLNSPAWSISTELFFYACFPFLVVNWTRTWRMKLGLAWAALAAVLLVSVRLPTTADGGPEALSLIGVVKANPLVRLFEFVVGMAACLAFRRLRAEWRPGRPFGTVLELLALAALLGTVVLAPKLAGSVTNLLRLPLAASLWLLLGGIAIPAVGLLVVLMALQAGWVSRCLGHPVLVLLGDMTYSIYLTHMPVLHWFSRHARVLGDQPSGLGLITYAAAAMLIAFLMWRLVERPCRKLRIGGQHPGPTIPLPERRRLAS